MEMMVWNIVLTTIVAIISFLVKSKFEEINRVSMLLNNTREEIARHHITRAEVEANMKIIMDRFDAGIAKLESKLDSLQKEQWNGMKSSISK